MSNSGYYLPPKVIKVERSLLETSRTMDHGPLSPSGRVSGRSRRAAHRRNDERLARLAELDRIFDWLRECPQETADREYQKERERATSRIRMLQGFVASGFRVRVHQLAIDNLKQEFGL